MSMILTMVERSGVWVLASIPTQVQDDVGQALDNATPYENWQLVLAFIVPLIVSLLIKQAWSREQKSIVAFVISAVLTVIGMYLDGSLLAGGFDVIATPLKVFPLAIAFYYGLWQPIGTTGAIHRATG